MITCPNCQHEEVAGSLFCSECGTQLVTPGSHSTKTISRDSIDDFEVIPIPQIPPMEALPESKQDKEAGVASAPVTFHLVDSGQMIPIVGRLEFTIGRVTEGQPILPDIDLSPYDAFSQGVSRLHAALKIINKKVVVVDLGSSNGTRVNGQKIVPNVDYPLNHGDIIALGKFKIQVLIHAQ